MWPKGFFSLFDSEVSDFNIVDYTPFQCDVVKELSEACHRAGLKFGATVTAASFLVNGKALSFTQQGETLELILPAEPLNEYDTVVKLVF